MASGSPLVTSYISSPNDNLVTLHKFVFFGSWPGSRRRETFGATGTRHHTKALAAPRFGSWTHTSNVSAPSKGHASLSGIFPEGYFISKPCEGPNMRRPPRLSPNVCHSLHAKRAEQLRQFNHAAPSACGSARGLAYKNFNAREQRAAMHHSSARHDAPSSFCCWLTPCLLISTRACRASTIAGGNRMSEPASPRLRIYKEAYKR